MKLLNPILIGLLFAGLLFSSCEKDSMDTMDPNPAPDNAADTLSFGLGWTGEDNLDEIPTATNFGFGNTNLPASVDLNGLFPPIGNQGQYGTCVSWAVGYNIKSAVDGQDRGLSTNALSNPANQFSPKDLFVAIPDNEKAPDCNGTNFSFALNVLQNRGVATMQTVPYTNLGDCSQANLDPSWTQEAAQHRIQYWRKIDPTVTSIKQNLANNIPVIMGARLADNFMTWNSDNVLTSGTTFNNVGQHAYHAIVVSGYDDNRGPNGAFRVINSWGTNWGDRGYIWIDYNYFINEFCVSFDGSNPLFIVANDGDGGNNNNDDNNPPTDPDPVVTGVDLAPWVFSDESTYWTSGDPSERLIDLNIYNIGNQVAAASANWSVYYIYFNAYDANDYGVLFYDEFNTRVATNTYDCPTTYNCIFNLDLAPGTDFASSAFGWESVGRTYYMPQITGYYYLVMVADAGDVFGESDELNNLFYTSMDPIWFDGGYARSRNGSGPANFEFQNKLQPEERFLKNSRFSSVVTAKFPNAYTTREISDFLRHEKRSGRLDDKIKAHIQGNPENVFIKQ